MASRVKVKAEHKKNLFFQKYLEACRETVADDRKQQFTLYKAIKGLKAYPLEVNNINELRQINGIGETIAARCEAAWEDLCSSRQLEPTLSDIKKITNEEYRRLADPRKKNSRKHNSPKKKNVTNEFEEPIKKKGRLFNCMKDDNTKSGMSNSENNKKDSEINKLHSEELKLTQTNTCETDEDNSFKQKFITCKPYDHAEVILICDTREDRKKKTGLNVIDVLAKNPAIRFETRVLAVGDFLWIARKIDGSEVVLDWIVERKTWDDLESSIRHGRYDEQKQRLKRAPINNRVYLIEDRGRGTVGAEQAVSTTRSRDGFLIQRCRDGKETAHFLEAVYQRLATKICLETITGISFKYLQEISEKGQIATVRNVWMEQITVCPGMSSYRAQSVVESFPSLPAFLDYCKSAEENGHLPTDLINRAIPHLPKLVATRLRNVLS